MRKLLLTLDYELFGDGSGDVFKHIVEPTYTILNVAESYGAKITVFFEVVEYWRLKKEWDCGNHMGYDQNPVEAIEKQILDVIARGHDVQLHIHPQWVDANWNGAKWEMDYSNWRLSSFSSSTMSLEELIVKGKQTIEDLITPSFPNYRCIALRAGGYNAHPSQNIVKAMRGCGIKLDSSVVPGAKENGALSVYNYSNIPIDLGRWNVEVCLEVPTSKDSNMYELPVVSLPIMRLFKFMSITRIKSILSNRTSAQASFSAKVSNGAKSGGFFKKLSFFFKKEYQTWDYCLFPKWMHCYYLRNISKQKERDTFVVIGHPKSLVSTNPLVYLLKKTQTKFSFPSVAQYCNNLGK